VAPFWIVKAVDVIEHICLGIISVSVDFAGCPFRLEGREESFHCRIVTDVA